MFNSKSVWGIDLGSSAVKAVKMVKVDKELVQIEAFDIIEYAELGYEPGVADEDIVSKALEKFLTRHEIRRDDVLVSMPGQHVFPRFIPLPPVDKKQIPKIVEYEARQQIPFDMSEVIWDYQPIRDDFEIGEDVQIGLFAVKRNIVESLLEDISSIRKNVSTVQISPVALHNFIKHDQAAAGELEAALIVIDIGAKNTDLVVISKETFWYRSLHVAGNNITEALKEKFNLPSFTDAENVKLKAAQSKHKQQIFEAIRPVLRNLVSEIQRSIGYFKSVNKDARLEDVLLLGNSIKTMGIEHFLSENLQYNIMTLSGLKTISLGEGVNKERFQENLPGLCVAIGLAVQGAKLSGMDINLLPKEHIQEQLISSKKPYAIAAGVLLTLSLIVSFAKAKALNNTGKEVQDAGKIALADAKKYEADYNAARTEVNKKELNFLAGVGYRRDFWIRAIEKMVDSLPTDIYVSSITSERGTIKELEEKSKKHETTDFDKLFDGMAGGGQGAMAGADAGAGGGMEEMMGQGGGAMAQGSMGGATGAEGGEGGIQIVDEGEAAAPDERLGIILSVETELISEGEGKRGELYVREALVDKLQKLALYSNTELLKILSVRDDANSQLTSIEGDLLQKIAQTDKQVPYFKKVDLLGQGRVEARDQYGQRTDKKATGTLARRMGMANQPTDDGADQTVKKYLVYDILCIVKTDEELEEDLLALVGEITNAPSANATADILSGDTPQTEAVTEQEE